MVAGEDLHPDLRPDPDLGRGTVIAAGEAGTPYHQEGRTLQGGPTDTGGIISLHEIQ